MASYRCINFLWILGHVGIAGIEKADKMVKDTVKIIGSPSLEIPFTDVLSHI